MICGNINNGGMDYTFEQAMYGTENYLDQNESDFVAKTNPNFNRHVDLDKVHDKMENIDWDVESKYHNSYRINGKNVIGRTLKAKKK